MFKDVFTGKNKFSIKISIRAYRTDQDEGLGYGSVVEWFALSCKCEVRSVCHKILSADLSTTTATEPSQYASCVRLCVSVNIDPTGRDRIMWKHTICC